METAGSISRGQLARRTGCNIETVRYYERQGILPEPRRSSGGHRLYEQSDVKRLGFVRRCRELGFSLEEIRGLLGLVDGGDQTCHDVQKLTLAHANEIHKKISDLRKMEKILKEMAARCDDGNVPECPILESLSAQR